MPDVFVLPSAELRGYCSSLDQCERCHYQPLVEEMEPYRERWDLLEDHLRSEEAKTSWVIRAELEEHYGKDFVSELNAEVLRLLGTRGSSFHEMADDYFSAQELAEASALLRVLFRHRKETSE